MDWLKEWSRVANDNKKRVEVVFNLDLDSDAEMVDYMDSIGGKYTKIIKQLLREQIEGAALKVDIDYDRIGLIVAEQLDKRTIGVKKEEKPQTNPFGHFGRNFKAEN